MASNATTCGFRLESIYRKHLNRFFPQLRYFSKKRQQRFFSNFFGQPFPFLNNHFSVKCTLSSTVQDEVKRKTVWLKSPFHSIKFSAIQIFPEMDAMILQFFFSHHQVISASHHFLQNSPSRSGVALHPNAALLLLLEISFI